MPTPVELALTSLLPTTNLLPQEVIDLATAFVAQSQSRASTLKPEEEIGRTYACCHVACQRMGKKLHLEIGSPAPPVKPTVYRKLLAYMNSLLRTPVTPRGRRGVDRAGNGMQSGESKAVVSVSEGGGDGGDAAAAAVTPSSRRKYIRVASQPGREAAEGLPSPSVAAPVNDALELPPDAGAEFEQDDEDDNLPAAKRPSKTPLRRKEKHARRSADGEDEAPGPAGLLPGLGTMFQSSVDWLSEERREDYAVWKQDVMREVGMIAARG